MPQRSSTREKWWGCFRSTHQWCIIDRLIHQSIHPSTHQDRKKQRKYFQLAAMVLTNTRNTRGIGFQKFFIQLPTELAVNWLEFQKVLSRSTSLATNSPAYNHQVKARGLLHQFNNHSSPQLQIWVAVIQFLTIRSQQIFALHASTAQLISIKIKQIFYPNCIASENWSVKWIPG